MYSVDVLAGCSPSMVGIVIEEAVKPLARLLAGSATFRTAFESYLIGVLESSEDAAVAAKRLMSDLIEDDV